jgi:hypothetical protein
MGRLHKAGTRRLASGWRYVRNRADQRRLRIGRAVMKGQLCFLKEDCEDGEEHSEEVTDGRGLGRGIHKFQDRQPWENRLT